MKYQTKISLLLIINLFFIILGYVFEDLKQLPHVGIAQHMFRCYIFPPLCAVLPLHSVACSLTRLCCQGVLHALEDGAPLSPLPLEGAFDPLSQTWTL